MMSNKITLHGETYHWKLVNHSGVWYHGEDRIRDRELIDTLDFMWDMESCSVEDDWTWDE